MEIYMNENDRLLSSKDAAKILGVCVSTIAKWRCYKKHNLPFVRIGMMCKYRLDDIMTFIEERTLTGRGEKKYSYTKKEGAMV